MTNVNVRTAAEADAKSIVEIYNEGIEDRVATFETRLRTVEDILPRVSDGKFPFLVACDATGAVLGWANISAYRSRSCYEGIGEFSIYVARSARGTGIGHQLLTTLIDASRERGFWKLLSRIFLANVASRALCRSCGFREVGIYEKHGQLDGQWLDVVIVERLLL